MSGRYAVGSALENGCYFKIIIQLPKINSSRDLESRTAFLKSGAGVLMAGSIPLPNVLFKNNRVSRTQFVRLVYGLNGLTEVQPRIVDSGRACKR
jgi:hypothetical protein